MENLRGREGSVSACCQAGTFLHSGQWVTRMMKSFIFFFLPQLQLIGRGCLRDILRPPGLCLGLLRKCWDWLRLTWARFRVWGQGCHIIDSRESQGWKDSRGPQEGISLGWVVV